MNIFAVDSFPACFRFGLMNMCVLAFSRAHSHRSVLGLQLFANLLAMIFPQTVSTSSSGFEWHGQLFFQAQPRLAAYILQTSSRQSRAHNHRLLSALLNGPIDQAGLRLVSVLRDQNYLAVSSVEQIAALAAFRSPAADVILPSVPPLVVTDDMLIALADDIIERTDRLARISEDDQPELHAMAKNSLTARLQRYSQWSIDLPAAPVLETPQARLSTSVVLFRLVFLLAGVFSVIALYPWPLSPMKVIWMPSNIWLIALALFCSMSLDQLPPLLFTVPDPSLRLTCVNWFLFLPCHPFLALVVNGRFRLPLPTLPLH
jgi:hypothetical protein